MEHRGSNTASIRIPRMDEERMRRPGQWWCVVCISFSALTLLVQ